MRYGKAIWDGSRYGTTGPKPLELSYRASVAREKNQPSILGRWSELPAATMHATASPMRVALSWLQGPMHRHMQPDKAHDCGLLSVLLHDLFVAQQQRQSSILTRSPPAARWHHCHIGTRGASGKRCSVRCRDRANPCDHERRLHPRPSLFACTQKTSVGQSACA